MTMDALEAFRQAIERAVSIAMIFLSEQKPELSQTERLEYAKSMVKEAVSRVILVN